MVPVLTFFCALFLPHPLHYIARNHALLKIYNSEDVSVGAWVAGLDVTRRHDTRFDTQWKSRGCQNKFLITHKQSASNMRDKHWQLAATGQVPPVDLED